LPNPFHPAPGAFPARIIGRDAELSAIRDAVRRARAGQAPSPIVIVGQRGMGKTVLLRHLRDLSGEQTLPLQIETFPGRSLASRVREKLDDLLESVEPLPDRAGNILKRTLKVLPKLSYELPQDAGAIAIGPQDELPETHLYRESLIAMLNALAKAAHVAKRYLTITIDEIQDADIASLETIATFVHESAQTKSPVLFAVAGLSETRDLMDRLRTYVQRWDTFDLRLLTRSETIDAIREPIAAQRISIEESALDLLTTESAGYPYFIQAYGSAVWECHRGKHITFRDAETGISQVKQRNEMSFYIRPLSKLTPREMSIALALAKLGPGAHAIGDVARELGVKAPDISSTRANLIKKHVIASPVPGRVEFRMPFTDRFLREHYDEYDSTDVRESRGRLRSR
jgi:type II secretory pathway predicted ATPase ExeA